jgi:hypothetical protein
VLGGGPRIPICWSPALSKSAWLSNALRKSVNLPPSRNFSQLPVPYSPPAPRSVTGTLPNCVPLLILHTIFISLPLQFSALHDVWRLAKSLPVSTPSYIRLSAHTHTHTHTHTVLVAVTYRTECKPVRGLTAPIIQSFLVLGPLWHSTHQHYGSRPWHLPSLCLHWHSNFGTLFSDNSINCCRRLFRQLLLRWCPLQTHSGGLFPLTNVQHSSGI